MATPAAVLSLLIRADGVDKTTRQVKGLDDDLNKANKTTSKSTSAFKKVGAVVGGIVAFDTLRRGVGAAVSEFEEARKVGALTSQVIKSTGGSANITAKQVADLAGSISKKVGIDDEAIQSGANLLLTFKNIRNETGKGRDIFNQATAAAVDLSAAGFGSLSSTSKQLGKALNDPVKGMTALGRSGVTFSEKQKKAIESLMATGKAADRVKAQQIVLREVQSQVGGSAAAQATSLDKLKVTLGNVAEAVGAVLVPAFDKAAKFLAEFLGQMMENRGVGGALISTFKNVGGALGDLIGAVKATVKWFEDHETATYALATAAGVVGAAFIALRVKALLAMIPTLYAQVAAWTALKVAMLTNPFVLVAAAIAALAAGVVIAYRESETFRKIVDAVWASIKTAVGWVVNFATGLDDLAGKVFAAGKAITTDLVGGIKGLVTDVVNAGKWLVGKIVEGVKAVPGVVSSAATWLKDRYIEYIKALVGAYRSLGGWVLGRIVDGFTIVREGLGTIGDWLKNRIFDFVRAAVDGFTNIGGWILGNIVDGIKTIWRGIGTVGNWLKDTVFGFVKDSVEGWKNIGGWVVDKFVEGFKSAGSALSNAAKWLKDKIVGAIKNLLGIDSPSKVFMEIGGHMIDGLIKGMGSKDVVGFVKKHLGGVASLATKLFGGIVGGGAGIGGKVSGTMKMAQAIANKFGLRVSSGYRSPQHNAAVGGVPNSLHTHGSPGNPGAIDLVGPVGAMNAALIWARQNLNLAESMVHDVGSGLHLHLGFFKKGGFARGLAVVGEGGPELVDFGSRGAQVYSNPQSQAMMAGGPLVNIEHMSVHSGFEARAFAADLAWRVQTA